MSLKSIYLRDFVIVEELELELSTGFTVLTGETGAGKSILIDALQLALGARADAAVVREGAQRCEISASFDATPTLKTWLEQAGLDAGDELLLKRTIDAQGKSRAWINGSPATVTQLRELGDQLVDIHGQHAWQSLTRPEAVRGLLDAYAGLSTSALHAHWAHWREASRALAQARLAQGSLAREQERLAWQIGEVDKLAPGDDEWDELNTQHSRLSSFTSNCPPCMPRPCMAWVMALARAGAALLLALLKALASAMKALRALASAFSRAAKSAAASS
jgi:DNA repair protein RecN (Recombination protein N)